MLGTWRASGKCVQGKSRMQLIVHTPIGMPYRVASEMLLNPVWLHSGSDCLVSISAKHKYINKTFLSESSLILYNPFHWCSFDLRVDSEERILCFWRQWGKIFRPHVAIAFVKSPFKVWIVLAIWSLVHCVCSTDSIGAVQPWGERRSRVYVIYREFLLESHSQNGNWNINMKMEVYIGELHFRISFSGEDIWMLLL